MKDNSSSLGHRLREDHAAFPPPSREEFISTVIVGGGMAGLSAAWKLRQAGRSDFKLFELESAVGGHSSSGKNAVSAYPWGAHYVPIPHSTSSSVIELFEELGVITGFDGRGRPRFNLDYICHDPEERLFYKGVWQEDLQPHVKEEWPEVERFLKKMAEFRGRRGSDGRRLFHIPVDESSIDQETRALDRLTMKEYMEREKFSAPTLNWYVNYCTRDDYGASYDRVSAWAGIHYFAARGADPADDLDPFAILTWPEGNGWLTRALQTMNASRIVTGALVFNVAEGRVDVFYPDKNKTVRYRCDNVIMATPRFVARRILEPWRENPPSHIASFEYAPWMVANVTLEGLPRDARHGFPLAWDNVSYESEMLGYVVATHQNLRRYQEATVLTVYWPLSDLEPAAARQWARGFSQEKWTQKVVSELESMHPGIGLQIRSVEVHIWGHGMIVPKPGFIWGAERLQSLKNEGRIFFAHSDMSGISIFEEAQHRGVVAAQQLLGVPRG